MGEEPREFVLPVANRDKAQLQKVVGTMMWADEGGQQVAYRILAAKYARAGEQLVMVLSVVKADDPAGGTH